MSITSINCLNCNSENHESERVCTTCGASLRPAIAQYYLDLADAEVTKGRYDLASKHLTKADAEMLNLSNEERKKYMFSARAFWLQGCIYYYKGMLVEAEQELLLAHNDLKQRSDGSNLYALILNRLGSIAYYSNKLEAAREWYQQCIELAMRDGDYATASKAIGNLGVMLMSRGKFDEATSFYQQALSQAEASGEPGVIAQMYRLMAGLYAQNGPYSLALDYAERGVVIARQLDDLYVRCLNLNTASTIHLRCGDAEAGAAYLREAYELTRHTNNKITTEAVTISLIEFIHDQSHIEPWFEPALKESIEGLGTPVLKGRYALQMAYHYISEQDWSRVRRLLQQLKQADSSQLPSNPILLTCTQVLLNAALGEWSEAEAQYRLAVSSDQIGAYDLAVIHEDYATMLLGRAGKVNNSAIKGEADEALSQAAAIYRKLGLPQRATRVMALASKID